MSPPFNTLRGYDRGWLRGDLVAGFTVWAVLVPEALAYASIAGVSPARQMMKDDHPPVGLTSVWARPSGGVARQLAANKQIPVRSQQPLPTHQDVTLPALSRPPAHLSRADAYGRGDRGASNRTIRDTRETRVR
jgi:Sulfate permease family